MSRFLRVFAIFFGLIFAGNAFAAGYTCDTTKQYTACAAGYYLSGTTAGNSCVACPANWTSVDGNTSASNTSCYRDITLSKYNASGTLTTNNGTFTGTTNATIRCYYNTTCTFPSASGLTRAGYKMYGGWSTTTSPSSSTTTSFKIVSRASSVTYYPAMRYVSTISLDNQGATTAGSTAVYYVYSLENTYLDFAITKQMTSSANSITVPTKTGYTFNGYYGYYTEGDDSTAVQIISSAGHLVDNIVDWYDNAEDNSTMYAQWEANEYTVSFDANGGSGGQSADVTATYDSAMPEISTTAPTKAACKFNGWYDAKTGGNQYYTAAGASARTWDKTAETTLYAQWTCMSISAGTKILTYNGSAQSCANVTAPTGANITYSASSGGTYDETEPTLTNFGSKAVYYKVSATGYTDFYGSYFCTMQKASSTITVKEGSTTLATGSTLSLTYPTAKSLNVTCSNGATPTASGDTTAYVTVSTSGSTVTLTPAAVGNGTIVTISCPVTTNYFAASASYTVNVANGTITISGGGNKTLTYNGTTTSNGTAQSCANVTASSPSDVTVTYSTSSGGTYSATAPTLTNVGSTTVYYKVAKDNYTTKTGNYTCTMGSKAMTVSASNKSKVYDGSALTCSITVTTPTSGATIKYGTASGTYNLTSAPTQTNVGSQTVYYQVTGDNFTTKTGSFTCSVTTATGSTVLKDGSTAVTNGSGSTAYPGTKTLTATCAGGATISSVTSATTSVATVSNSGNTITLTPKATGSSKITVNCPATTNYNASSATYTWTVNPGTISATVKNNSQTYNGSALTCDGDITGLTPSGATVQYATQSSGTCGSYGSAPTRTTAGTTTVCYKISATNYTDKTGTFTCSVDKANNPITIGGKVSATGTVTFPSGATATVSNASGGTLSVTTSDSNIATASVGSTTATSTTLTITAKAQGTATITVTSAATTNYKAGSATYAITINPGTITISGGGNKTLTYNGTTTSNGTAQSCANVTASSPSDVTVTYSTSSGGTYSATAPTLTNVGSTTVYYKVAKDNYTTKTGNYTCTMGSKAMTVSASNKSKVYDGSALTCSITVTTPTSGATIKYGTASGTYNLTSAPTQTNVGSQTVYYQVTGDNFTTKTGSFTCSVTKATMDASLAGNSKTYDGTALTCNGGTQTGVPSGSTITYGTSTSSYSSTIPTVTNVADSKTIYYKITNSNYNDFTGSFSCTVSNATMTVSASNKTLTYTGSAQSCGTVSVSVPSSGATVKYGTTNGSYTTTSAITKTDAGTYTIYYQVTATNYTTKTGSFTCTVDKAANPISLSAASGSINYNGTGTFTVSGAQGTVTATSNDTSIATVSLSGTTVTMTGKKAGSTTITVSAAGNANYYSGSKTYTVTVNKIAGTTTLGATSGTLTYPTTSGSFTVSCSESATPTVSLDTSTYASATVGSGKVSTTWKAADGTTKITVNCPATTNYKASSATYTLYTKKAANPISLSAASGSINYNGTGTFTVSGAQGTVTATSNDTSIATVSLSGTTVTMTGKKAGSTTITVSAAGNANYYSGSKTYTVTVNKIAGTTTLNKTTMTLTYPTTTGTFTASCSESGAPSASSNATGVATVSAFSSGTATVTWKSAGSATITVNCPATTNYNASSKTIAVTTAKGTNTLTLSASSGNMAYSTTKTFTVSNNTSGGALSVATSNSDVATATISGTTVTITSKTGYGAADITVTSAATDNYNSASAKYTITVDLGTITLNNQSASTAGTTAIYQKYNTNVYLDSARSKAMTTSANPITIPKKSGVTFKGYYSATSGGTQYINANGYITSDGLTAGKALKANGTWYAQWSTCPAGSVCNGSSVTTCPAGSFCPEGSSSATKCPGLYVNSAAGSDANTDCYFTTTAGKYMVAATDTAQTTCPAKQYCTAETLYYPNVSVLNDGGWNDCPAISGHQMTTIPDNYRVYASDGTTVLNTSVTIYSAVLQSWTKGMTAVTSCRAVYGFQNEAGIVYDESVKYNASTGKYDIPGSATYYSRVNQGYYVKERYSATRCDNSSSSMIYKKAVVCPAGSYCPGLTNMPLCSSGISYTDDGLGKYSCADETTNYASSAEKSTSINSCYLTTGTGNFVKTANAAQETCTCGGYCPGSVTVYYGSTGGKTDCVAGKYNSATGSSASSACKTTDAGYYAAKGSCSQTAVSAGRYTAGGATTANGDGAVNAGYYNTGCGTNATGSVCSTSYSGGTIAAGRYGAAGATTAQGSGAVNAGYYSTGGGTSATPTKAGTGCISSKECGPIAAGRYGAAGATTAQGSGAVNAGYYSTGGGTSATPTAAGNGCLSSYACGKVTAGCYTTSTGSTTACPNECPGDMTSAAGSDAKTDCKITCTAGNYLAAGGSTCSTCTKGNYCANDGTYNFNANSNQGIAACSGTNQWQADTGQTSCDSVTDGMYKSNNYTLQNCGNAYYCKSGARTACTTATGWSTATTSTTASAYTACYQTQTPSGCASGTIKRTASSISGTTITYGTASVSSALSANKNYYVSGTSCPVCTNLGAFYTTSLGGAIGSGSCYGTTTGGKYIKTQYSSTQETCPAGSYCPATNVYYGKYGTSSGGQNLCPAGTANANTGSSASSACVTCAAGTYNTTTGNTTCSTCTANYYCTGGTNRTACTSLGSFYTTSASGSNEASDCYGATTAGKYIATANTSTQTACTANYYCPATNIYYGSTGGRNACTSLGSFYTTSAASSDAASDCYGTTTGGKYIATANTSTQTACTANYYCPATNIYYGSTGGRSACVSPYTKSATSSDDANDCYLTTTATKYVKEAGAGEVYCPAGSYCAGGVTIYKGGSVSGRNTTGGSTSCPANSYCPASSSEATACNTLGGGLYASSSAGSDAASDCYIKTTAGKYVKAKTDTTQTTCPSGDYCLSTTLYWENVGGNTDCPGSYTAGGTGVTTQSGCKISVADGKYVGTKNSSTLSTCAGGTYKSAHTVAYGSTSSCSTCSAGYYCPEGAGSQTECGSNNKYSSSGAASCSTVTSGYYSTGGTETTRTGQSQCTGATYCTSGVKYDCPSGYTADTSNGKTAATQCDISVTGGKYIGTAGDNSSNWDTCACGTYKAAHTVAYGSTSSCAKTDAGYYAAAGASSQTKADAGYYAAAGACSQSECGSNNKYSSSGAASCSTVTSGYYSTGGTETTRTGQSQCTGATYCTSGVKYDCPSGYTADTSNGKTAATQCDISVTGGKYVGTKNSATLSTCLAGTYKAAHTVAYGSTSSCAICTTDNTYSAAGASSCSSCPTDYKNSGTTAAAHANAASCIISVSAGKYIGTAGDNSSNWDTCAGGTYKAAHTVAYGSTSSCSTCSAGYYCPAGAGSQTACGSNNKYSSSGAASCSTVTSGYYSTGGTETTRTGQTKCEAGNYCSSGVKTACGGGKYSSAGATSCSNIDAGCYGTSATSSCPAVCAANTYSNAGASSCTACDSDYANSGTTAANHAGVTSCKVTCAAGTYVASNGAACTDVGNGYYRSGTETVSQTKTGTRNACTALGAIYKASDAGRDASTDCYATTTAKSYVKTAKDATETSCPAGSYCPGSVKVYYNSTGGSTPCPAGKFCVAGVSAGTECVLGSYSAAGASACTACQDGKTTSAKGATSCNATCSNATGVSDWETASWATTNTMTNLCTIAATAGCSANYYKNSNACSTCSSGTNSKYTLSAAGTTSVNSCYLKTTEGKYVATKGAGETACISPYYCPGGTTIYYGTGTTTGGNSTCTGLGAIYKASDAGASKNTQCYATTSAGKYVTAKATSEAACPAGDWCAGSVKVYYGSAGGNTDCPSGYTSGTTGYSAQSQCLMSVAGGKYVATEKESSASGTCAAGYYKPAHTVNYGGTSSCSACTGATYQPSTGQASCLSCPAATNDTANVSSYSYWNGGSTGDHTVRSGCNVTFKSKTLDDGVMTAYSCYVDTGADTYGIDGTSKTCWVNRNALTCNGGYYNSTFNNSSTATQYTSNKTLTDLYANVCQAVGTGYYSANDALTRTACGTGLVTCGSGACANEADDCGRKLHMGANTIYLRGAKRGTPALNVKIGDKTFYGVLSTSLSSKAKVKNGTTTYSVVNDNQ